MQQHSERKDSCFAEDGAESVEHYLIRFVLDCDVNLVGVLFGNIVDLLIAFFKVVFGNELILFLLFKVLVGISSDVTKADF